MKQFLMLSAAAFLAAGAAQAQTPAAPAQPAAPAATAAPAAATTVSDAELTKFAKLAREIKSIMDTHQPMIAAAADADAKTKAQNAMSGELQVAVTDNGFTVQRYNEIATAMQKDPTLVTRMQQLASAGASAPANP